MTGTQQPPQGSPHSPSALQQPVNERRISHQLFIYFRFENCPAQAMVALERRGADVWTIYNNTTFGAVTCNALELAGASGMDGCTTDH